jgi:hypothetical protein
MDQQRVDGLTGDDKDKAPAVMFARNALHKDNVLVDIDVNRTDGFLQLRRLHLAGNMPKNFDAKSTRGIFSGGQRPTYSKKRS